MYFHGVVVIVYPVRKRRRSGESNPVSEEHMAHVRTINDVSRKGSEGTASKEMVRGAVEEKLPRP